MQAVQKEVVSALSDFGLSDVEIAVYQTLLALGARPASVVAQRSGLKRAHTYNVLQALMQRGIVQEYIKGSVKHFTCSPPQTLVSMMDRREQELAEQRENLEKVLPQLERLQSPVASQPKVRFFQGFEGIKEVYEDMLRYPNEIIYGATDIAYSWTFTKGEGQEWIRRFIKRRAEQNIWWYGIMNRSKETLEALTVRPWLKRKVKLVDNLNLPVEFQVYATKVAITSTHGEMLAILIENVHIADTMKSVHQAIWNTLPDFMPPESALETAQ